MSFERIVNRTPMAAYAEVLEDLAGRRVLTVIAKITWGVDRAGEVSLAAGRPVRHRDVRRKAGVESSLQYPSDLCVYKPGTDVILVATAHPPKDRAVSEMDVGLRIATAEGALQKGARVYGPRVYQRGARGVVPGPAGALAPTPLVHELTYGGVDRSDPQRLLVDWRNPVGVGVARDPLSLVGKRAALIEDLHHPLGERSPAPAGFGAIPAHWAPRSGFGGTLDERWRRERAPLLPIDADPRFFCCAAPGLWSAKPLRGDERIELTGLTPEGLLRFRLPRYAPVLTADVRGAAKGSPCPTHLDTLLIDADRREVEVTFRAGVPLPRKLQAIERVTIEAEGEPIERMIAERRERTARMTGEETA